MSIPPILPLLFIPYSSSHLISTTPAPAPPPPPTQTTSSIYDCPESKFQQEASFTLDRLKNILETKGFVLIPGKVMKKLLIQHGASEEDLAVLESGYIHKKLPVDQQPTMYHRLVNCQAPSQIPKPPRPSPNPVKSSQNQFQRDWG